MRIEWSGREDSNLRPLGPEPSALVKISSAITATECLPGNCGGNWECLVRRQCYQASARPELDRRTADFVGGTRVKALSDIARPARWSGIGSRCSACGQFARVRDLPVADRADVRSLHRGDGRGLSLKGREFDFVGFAVSVDAHNGADVACLESLIGHWGGQDDPVEFSNHRGLTFLLEDTPSPGAACRVVSSIDDPDGAHHGFLAGGRPEDAVNDELPAVFRRDLASDLAFLREPQ